MSERLKNKVAIVVGAGSTPGDTLGNGRATSILFAREGASVMLVDRDLASAEETARMITDEDGESFAFEADVTSAGDCSRMADACAERYGRIDILHNNVGIGIGGGPVELSEEDWNKVMDTNLKGMYLTCKYVLPYMEQQGSGAIVNISSRASVRHLPYPMLAYSTSKGGVNALTRSIAMQYAHQGIRVNCILPGLINTPMAIEGVSAGLGIDKNELIRLRSDLVPMKRMGEAWDVAYASLFLASDEAKYITGVIMPVDGGISWKGWPDI
jgi:NAD(P)-dependent dehydrogenase (short-subunit alcohol dehydrogenase family)